ncbi:hypothetical protein ACFFJN_02675 [Erwinia mallotivora]
MSDSVKKNKPTLPTEAKKNQTINDQKKPSEKAIRKSRKTQ